MMKLKILIILLFTADVRNIRTYPNLFIPLTQCINQWHPQYLQHHHGLRGLKQEQCKSPYVGSLRVECQDNSKKIFVCHYDKELDKHETLCIAEKGACNQLKHHDDSCGECVVELKDEITYDLVPETGEQLPRCVNDSQVCSGSDFCLGACIECAQRGHTMAIKMKVKLD